MPREKKYDIGLVGLGHRGYQTHFLGILGSRSERIIAVCDTSEQVRTAFNASHPDIPIFASLQEMLDAHTFDFVIVSVPNKYHFECIKSVAARGVPVLKEKPVADSYEELTQLVELPVKIGVTLQKRFEPRYTQLQKLLPHVGKAASFNAKLGLSIEDLERTWRAGDGVGVTEDLGCHMLDMVVWLFGLPSRITAHRASSVRRFQEYEGEDIVEILMQFPNSGLIGYVHLSRVAHEKEESITVSGTAGTLLLQGKEITLHDPSGNRLFHMVDGSEKKFVVRSMAHQFGDWITGRAPTYVSSLVDLQDTVSLIQAVRRSFISGRTEQLITEMPTRAASVEGDHHIWPVVTPESEDAVINQMHSSLSIYNRSDIYEVFEDRWRDMHCLKHALVCSSGTAAILHMYEALDLRPGDEILCPVYTFFATASPMLQYGAVPIFCDALPDGNLDPAEIPRKSTPKTKALIVTHMWGLPCRMAEIMKSASHVNGGIAVLEDCSHTHGAMVDGRIVGSWGHMAAWSLQAKKNITGGQAGVLGTNSTDYYSRAVMHGHFNKRAKQEVPENHPLRKFWLTGIGLNLRAHPLAIALANQQLTLYPFYDSYRQRYARYLARILAQISFLDLPAVANTETDKHSWYAFVMLFRKDKAPAGLTRERFVDMLISRGLKEVDIPGSTGLLNGLPLFSHTHEAIPRYGDKPWHAEQPDSLFPVAVDFYKSAIKLPMWTMPGDEEIVEKYANTFLSVARELKRGKHGKDEGKNNISVMARL